MIFYTVLKNQILKKEFLYVFLIVILFGIFIMSNIFFQNKEITIGIKDIDKTEESKKLIENIRNISDIEVIELEDEKDIEKKIISGEISIYYEIKRGFSENIFFGNISKLIKSRARENVKEESIINDKISLEIIKKYIEMENYRKVNNIDKISYDKFQNLLDKNYDESQILKLEVKNANGKKSIDNGKNNIFILIPLFISNFFALESFSRIVKYKKRNIFKRLSISGITYKKIYYVNYMVYIVKSFIISILSLAIFRYKIFYLIPIFISLNLIYLIYLLFENILKNKEAFEFISKILFFIMIFILYFYYYLTIVLF